LGQPVLGLDRVEKVFKRCYRAGVIKPKSPIQEGLDIFTYPEDIQSHAVPLYPDQGKRPATQEHCLILQLAVPGAGLEVE
jgi:hypothetical protein